MKVKPKEHRMYALAALAGGMALLLSFMLISSAQSQDQDHDRYWDEHEHRFTRITPGTIVAVRTNEPIDVDQVDYRVFQGRVDQDVRGENGRMAIPKGSGVELMVRRQPDNDLSIDIESVRVNDQRYALKTDVNHQEARRDDTVVGSIVGALSHGQAGGRAVHIPGDTVLTFRIQQPLDIGVEDHGVDRDGQHYHDYDRGQGDDRDRDH